MATPRYTDVLAEWARSEALGLRLRENTRHPKLQIMPGTVIGDQNTPLVETLRTKTGKFSRFLLNGDGGPSSTFRNQQWTTRAAARGRREWPFNDPFWDPEPPSPIIIPFSALDAAGVDRSTIVPIEIRDDRQEEEHIVHQPWNEKEIRWKPVRTYAPINPRYSLSQRGTITGRRDLLFDRKVTPKESRPPGRRWGYVTLDESDLDIGRTQVRNIAHRELEQDSDGIWRSSRFHHRLGDSVFSAVAHGARRLFVSSFDYQERWPLYFLAELPWHCRGHIQTVDAAIMALSPPIVHAAVAQDRNVLRQGDMFAIPTSLSTRDVRLRSGRPIRRMRGVFGTDHLATEQYVCKGSVTYARGWLHHRPIGRRPDHASTHLGKEWHLIVPNSVPRRRAGAMVRG